MHFSLVRSAKGAVALHAVAAKERKKFLAARGKREAAFLKAADFAAKEGELKLVPDASGGIAFAVLGLGDGKDPLICAAFCEHLPPGVYRFETPPASPELAALGWALGAYRFARYRKDAKPAPKLVVPEGVDAAEIGRIAGAVFLARDLINTPPNDMGPEELAAAVQSVAKQHGAKFSEIAGEALLKKNYPLIHAVGKGSARAPRLAQFVWGRPSAPKVTLVGKGVVFDTGGYDLKTAAGMSTMKKDMGGAAVSLAVASMVMDAKLDMRLRVLIPAVENSVSGSAYRPSDVLPSRKGLTVEIGNTDAEGRLVLADALAEADSEAPELLLDIATLTGAARVATGMELPPFFTDDETLAADLMRHSKDTHDPLWRLPLWRGYEPTLSSAVADLNNAPDYPYAGAITAALFLNRFVTKAKSWAHFDIAAWVDRPRPGRRRGAEATAARAIYAMLKERYGRGE
ncbi:MAG: leucyl aminopeptidase family protein [Alphaproteobacteria bacterium]|nr:leucyl aminopeptidase family protein [Alphaproteobacteria bacterium]MDE2112965.1 leucyl aminopeptidase family protein [Alphaproteobacteria bacterium]MDE2493318.1 leucyl aminopeptidase family protein [Alphaproteobacteria bacterium]